MKTVTLAGNRQVRIVDVPTPQAAREFVVVKVHLAPLCTEWKLYGDGQPASALGHEAAGEVVEVAQPGKVQVGDRVVVMPLYACGRCALCGTGDYIHCQHQADVRAITGGPHGTATYAQYLVKPDWLLVPVPADLSYEHAAMACCGLGPTFGAMQRLGVDALDTVLIAGLGPVGLGGVINARYRGAQVIATELVPYRIALGRALGATVVDARDPEALKQVLALTGGRGVDKAVDCTGVVAAQRLLIQAARRRGQVAFVGEGGDLPVHVSNDLLRKGLALHGIWHWNLGDAPRIMQTIRAVGPSIDRQITHRFPLDQVEAAWQLQVTHECGKVLMQPWG